MVNVRKWQLWESSKCVRNISKQEQKMKTIHVYLGLQSNERSVTFIPVCESLYRHSLQSELRMLYMENMSVSSRPSISEFYQIWYTSSLQKVVTQM
jgi:hypothetical protein